MIRYGNNSFELPGSWTYRAKAAPDRKYHPGTRTWRLPNNRANRAFLLSNFMPTDFDQSALAVAKTPDAPPTISVQNPVWPDDLLDHQRVGLEKACGIRSFAFFHEMGSGKSRTLLELWKHYYHSGLIDEAWVICPNALIDNWHEQIGKWAPDLKNVIKVYGILSLSAGALPGELVARAHDKLAVAVDESQRIKNAQAKRSRVMHEIGKHAAFTAVLTGTSVTKGIEDLYSQYYFLDPNILGYKSFFAFRNRYCLMGGFENRQIVAYQNVAELMKAVEPFTHVVKDPVKLPPQTREMRTVELSPEQKRLMKELKNQMQTEMAGTKLTVTNALTYYTRGAQIVGGFFPLADGGVMRLPNNNKLDELMEVFASTDKKIVVFARFVAEAKMIMESLQEAGIKAVWLARESDDKMALVNQFQDDPDTRAFISTYAMGSVGYTLTAGKVLVEYSGTFNYEESVQARKRIDRIGQTEETKVIRLMANCKLDRAIKDISDRKQTMADFVTTSLADPKQMLSMLE